MKVFVHTPFILQRLDETKIKYEVGEQDIPEEDALHSYSTHHLNILDAISQVEEQVVEEIVEEVKPKKSYGKK